MGLHEINGISEYFLNNISPKKYEIVQKNGLWGVIKILNFGFFSDYQL